ncbi:MAG TPA: prepilin-type N-terminal cleavage/methylation domain-containing protein [Dehalococcoidia bacterium]|nr:prepilin-type N-terminal cleavage/methylation domain-containing protein [Dehalococcoidia bacterium]
MSRINDHNTPATRGFTLVELMVALSVSLIIVGGVLAAYLFIGRNLTRLINLQQQDVQSRRTLRRFTQDLSAAISLSTATTSQLVFTKPTSSGNVTITYTYTAGGNGTLSRNDGTTTQTLLSNVTSFTVNYYNESGTAVTSSPQSVKSAEIVFTSAVGTAAAGTLASFSTVSPRVVLRNKPALQ